MELKRTTKLLLAAIEANERGSYREWAEATGIATTSTIGYHLRKLEAAGKIRMRPGQARSVELVREGRNG